jgi:hypothetical protein
MPKFESVFPYLEIDLAFDTKKRLSRSHTISRPLFVERVIAAEKLLISSDVISVTWILTFQNLAFGSVKINLVCL